MRIQWQHWEQIIRLIMGILLPIAVLAATTAHYSYRAREADAC